METFSALLALCKRNSPVSGEFPAQRPVTRSFDVFFDLPLIKRLSKHSRGWWFEALSRHRNVKLLPNLSGVNELKIDAAVVRPSKTKEKIPGRTTNSNAKRYNIKDIISICQAL